MFILTVFLIAVAILNMNAEPVYNNICPDGYTHDKLFPNTVDYTCKPGPAKNPKCAYFVMKLPGPVECPDSGYVSGWYFKDEDVLLKCCKDCDKEIYRTDCIQRVNSQSLDGGIFRFTKGRAIVGFEGLDDGTFLDTECKYRI